MPCYSLSLGGKREKEMGRYTRKCRRIVEVAVMEVVEVTQVVGVRTRARALALAAGATVSAEAAAAGLCSQKRKTQDDEQETDRSETGEVQVAYLQLRNRSLVMTERLSKSGRNLDGKQLDSVDQGRISRCSSISSCEAEKDIAGRFPTAGNQKLRVDLGESGRYLDCVQTRSDTTLSCNSLLYSGEMESTAEQKSRQSTSQIRMPSATEIEEFFTAAEKTEKQRFASKYNFDVDLEAPLNGRYEWVRINS